MQVADENARWIGGSPRSLALVTALPEGRRAGGGGSDFGRPPRAADLLGDLWLFMPNGPKPVLVSPASTPIAQAPTSLTTAAQASGG
jgi:hypothetical protein